MTSPASPRLPSPPPIPEDQVSPVSASPEQQKLFSNLDHAAERRIRPGTKAVDMAKGPPLIDSAFQLTEYLKALHHSLTHPTDPRILVPVDKQMAFKIAHAPENVDKTLWLYELCRFLIQEANSIFLGLLKDKPPCSVMTCPEMRASEWQYLCAVHDPPKSCCAFDYCSHTLDWAGNILTSPKHFPSRLALGTDSSTQHSQTRQLTNIFRRVYRIFAHAWYSHRDVFWKIEGKTGLYVLYKTVCDVYSLVPEDNYTIPPEAEGIDSSAEPTPAPPVIMKREPSNPGPQRSDNPAENMSDNSLSTAGTTKRHRHSPSVGPTAVHTVVEENEDEEEGPVLQSRPAEAESAEDATASEDKDGKLEPAKQNTSEETVDPAPKPDEEPGGGTATATEPASAETTTAEVSNEEPVGEQATQEEATAVKDADKPTTVEAEEEEKPESAVKPADKDNEAETRAADA
ncbi:Mob1 family protein [Pyrenophora tritici-repentis]|uniref:Mob1 family protein n=1 Tax=Pyrenophora tritici-repentis TaxID=45151 RepID=A0A2W1F9N1_9PLEO|nr:Mob1 family protein [Pyrenophora tritici-repentis]KAI0582170.1 mob1 family protein [Pyrenophora tritici-repentis]KAI1536562.1 Mob1 family protein [Pyrenophora tritici-repentis]KAI1538996.1 Mob1 family protein [Pyrenophora tritici-repentis]KAI1551455.1 Mob1 family protein [Pyrenophora tritici-repentis]